MGKGEKSDSSKIHHLRSLSFVLDGFFSLVGHEHVDDG